MNAGATRERRYLLHWAGPWLASTKHCSVSWQHPQGEERENIPTDTMAKADAVSVAPRTEKKQWKRKSTCLVRDEEASPKREQERESEEAACSAAEQSQEQKEEETEIINETETTRSLSLSELRDI